MAQYIDLDELQAELSAAKGNFNKWSAVVNKTADGCKHAHFSSMRSAREEITNLQDRYKQVERLAQHVQQRMGQDESEAQTLHHVAQGLHAEKQALQRRAAELQRGLDAQEGGLADQGQDIAGREAKQARSIASLDKVLTHYQRSLGLEMQPGEDELRLSFTHIDPSDPGRRFSFAVQVQEDESYEVISCEPELPCLPQLAAELRQGSDFAGFVKAMRREFRSLATHPA